MYLLFRVSQRTCRIWLKYKNAAAVVSLNQLQASSAPLSSNSPRKYTPDVPSSLLSQNAGTPLIRAFLERQTLIV